jgi:predicted glutamine amidotransferase
MCRFVLYQGQPLTIASLVTEPSHSIIHQSTQSREADDPLNGDGFGVAWYAPDLSPRPAVFRSVSPAWSNMNLLELARVTKSTCILAHVRAATPGLPVTELNCHPFSARNYAFMHNGDVAHFGAIRRKVLDGLSDEAFQTIKGSTDSEHLFGVFLDKAAEMEAGRVDPTEVLARSLEATVSYAVNLSREAAEIPLRASGGGGRVREAGGGAPANPDDNDSYLNIAVSDGTRSVACRYTTDKGEPASLYVHTGRRYQCDGGVCRMVSPERGKGAVIVCSEPLSDDPGWQKIPKNSMVVINEHQECDIRKMN